MFGVTSAHPQSLRTRYAHIGRRRKKPGFHFMEIVALGVLVAYSSLVSLG